MASWAAKHSGALLLGGIAGFVVVGLIVEKEKKAAASTVIPVGPTNTVTLAAGPQSVGPVAQGATITLVTPANGQIVTITPSATTTTTGGSTITPTASGYATIIWTSASGASQTTTLNYTVVNESGQQV
jgi:hypothetical protein